MIKKWIKVLVRWALRNEIDNLKELSKKVKGLTEETAEGLIAVGELLKGIDVSVDVHAKRHQHSPSWAVISIQGQKTDYIKFVDLGNADMREIASFLRRYEKSRSIKVDAWPAATEFLKIPRK